MNNFVTHGRQRGTTDAKEGTVSNPVQMRPSREGCKAALEGGPPELFLGENSSRFSANFLIRIVLFAGVESG